jgi:hypothetical protein
VDDDGEPKAAPKKEHDFDSLARPVGEIPSWVILPPSEGDGALRYPPGRAVYFLRFRAEWTDTPQKGDRQCVVWPLSDRDEKLAYGRINLGTSGVKAVSLEMAKQMVRAIDGVKVNWSGKRGPSSIDEFWTDIGARCRSMIERLFLKTHSLDQAQVDDFFENCVASLVSA